ncbi:ABC transporter permease [Aciditerrimonas ferrireducens]|jgi:simple sugar transport system permease protein|uniref:Xylose transport system permease protein XylH n=1 Tax=Aciditerrimonas ferrireducens TaxID=667306 RepID=A0ABV6C1Q2_9ACTN
MSADLADATTAQDSASPPPLPSVPRPLTSYVSGRMIAVIAVIVAVLAVLTGTSGGKLLSATNLGGALDASSEVGFIAIGVTMLMIGGEFDLSVGQVFVVGGLAFAGLDKHIGFLPAIIVTLLLAGAIGLINGIITVVFGIPSFITTLGTYYAIAGFILLITGASPVSYLPPLPHVFSVFSAHVGGLGFRWEVVWWIGLAALAAWILHRTSFGNHVFAAGGNPEAARGTGVRVGFTKIVLFVACSALSAFSGIVLFCHLGSMEVTAGSGLQLQAIAAAVIGGTALFGGVGTIFGGVLGSFFLGVLTVGLVLSGASTQYYELFVGIVLIGAVIAQVKTVGASRFVHAVFRRNSGR